MQRDVHNVIAENLARVRGQKAEAARRAGRRPDEVAVVGVTKYVDADLARALFDAGLHDLAESRPQELWQKAEALRDRDVCWHQVGHIQRNKVRRTVPVVGLLHSLDSPRLAAVLDEQAGRLGRTLPALIEVNISGDEAKHGFMPDDVEPLLDDLAGFKNLRIRGLMTMAALEGGPERARRDFARLRGLRDRLKQNCPAGITLDELSMGMSADFHEAIAEGATIVRIGTALFEGAMGRSLQ
ncbi:MAG: YggS family pyridoxal phosphate-dependent enzyme [Pirellulales bacterium]